MLAEVRPDGFTMPDTCRLAFADGLIAARDDAQPLWMRTLRETFFSGRHV
ncbi:hypothetical protein [Burkholderia sp. Bp8998]|nr:hypothetical protein [Burkholderia sp. Bp8998]